MATTTNQTSKTMVSSINKFVKLFLSGDDVSVESWTSSANQKQLKAVLSGKEEQKKKKRQRKKSLKNQNLPIFSFVPMKGLKSRRKAPNYHLFKLQFFWDKNGEN